MLMRFRYFALVWCILTLELKIFLLIVIVNKISCNAKLFRNIATISKIRAYKTHIINLEAGRRKLTIVNCIAVKPGNLLVKLQCIAF
jgi:hypothetical protein